MIHFFSSTHFQLLIGVCAACLFSWLMGKWYPRQARAVVREVDRWSGVAIIAFGLLVLICGFIGFGNVGVNQSESIPVALYETFQLFAFNVDVDKLKAQNSLMLSAAMLSAMALAVTVAAKGIMLLFHKSYTQWQLRASSKHVVILGLGRIGRQLIADLIALKDRRTIVVVEPDEDSHDVAWAREHGVIVIAGDATKRESLQAAQVHRADEIFVVTGGDECNIECVIELRDIVQRLGRRDWLGRARPALRCHVHVLDRDLAEILRKKLKELQQNDQFDVEVFNALERTARRLLEDIATATLNGQPIRPIADHEFAHVVLLGFGEFGQTLALKLAELGHFENGKRMRMTIVDRDIAQKARQFVARHSQFGADIGQIPAWNFDPRCDDWDSRVYRPEPAYQLCSNSPGIDYVCNTQYVEYVEATDPTFLQGLNQSCQARGAKPVILVCFEDDRQNFAIGERLLERLKTQEQRWPIFVWIPRQRELSQLLSETSRELCDLIPFGQCYGSVSYTEVTGSWSEWLARHLHLIWLGSDQPGWQPCVEKLQQAIVSRDLTSAMRALDWEALDKVAKCVWGRCDEWERASNRSAAIHSVLKAAALGQRIEGLGDLSPPTCQIDVTPALDESLRMMEHYRWLSERLIAGWRYDPERSNVKKTRWQITPWDGLETPPQAVIDKAGAEGKVLDEKHKDELIVRMVVGLMMSGKLKLRS